MCECGFERDANTLKLDVSLARCADLVWIDSDCSQVGMVLTVSTCCFSTTHTRRWMFLRDGGGPKCATEDRLG